jgi:hypothetical protein
VIEFPTIDAPPEWIFRLGVAMPERAEIDGGRVGAERRCIFNKGGFTEPIEVWEPRRELTFGVSAQPAGLDRYLDVRRGQFLLRPAGASRTVLEGRTWCELKVYPVFYWLAWSDGIIETIHGRVLRHIRRLAEEDRRRVAAQE